MMASSSSTEVKVKAASPKDTATSPAPVPENYLGTLTNQQWRQRQEILRRELMEKAYDRAIYTGTSNYEAFCAYAAIFRALADLEPQEL